MEKSPSYTDQVWLERLQKELNEAQYRFVTSSAPVILGLAGPGSGKTRALVYRAAHLVRSGFAPEQLLLLTFTNKAAEEMKQRLEKLLGFLPVHLWAGTFHSTGARILRRHAPLLGRESNFTILDEDDSRNLLKHLVHNLSAGLLEEDRNLLIKRGFLARVISQARNSDLSVEQVMETFYPRQAAYLEIIQTLAARYEEKKREINAFDFDDLLIYWLTLFVEHPEVRENYLHRFEHVLVDEFQDTNIIQARIIDSFAGHCAVCVVGDDAQSIYAFRFADVGNIVSFPEKYPNCEVIPMERNYRSTPEIVALADHAISFNRGQLPKKLFSHNPPGEKPRVVGTRNAALEASFVGFKIEEIYRQGVPLREMAVLYRSSYLSSELEFELSRRGLPYRVFGGLKFLQKAHIKDILAYLRVLYNPGEEVSWRRIATLQRGLGEATFDGLWQQLLQNGDCLEAALSGRAAPARGKKGWEALCRALQAARLANSIPDMIARFLKENYYDILKREYPDQVEERLRGIERLAAYGGNYATLEAFLQSLSLEESLFADSAALEGKHQDSLTLSTVHSAKGKEWDTVFVIGLNEGHFPGKRGDEDIEEERRLFYVAVTRAKQRLFLTTYREDYRQWGTVIGGPSRFLRELPRECYRPVLFGDYGEEEFTEDDAY